MAGETSRRLALDTNVLLDLAGEEDFAHSFRELALENKYALVVPPTVVRELAHLSEKGERNQEREWAQTALENMLTWKISPFNVLPVGNGIAHTFSETIRKRGYLDDDEVNDGIILAEVALYGTRVLITSDKHLLDIDQQVLNLAFAESDLVSVTPMHPKKFSRVFRKGR